MITEMLGFILDDTKITVEVIKKGNANVQTGVLLIENYENGNGKKEFNEFTLGFPCGDEWLEYLNNFESKYSWTITDKLHPREYQVNF